MISFKNLFNKRWDTINSTIILTLFGYEIKIKKQYSFSTITRKIETLHYILNNCIDIKNCKPAKGILREMQLDCCKILEKIDKICKENNLCYWLDAGTLLGVIRHKGFIPWDDDIDICMPRKDYDKIFILLEQNFDSAVYKIRLKAEIENNFQIRIIHKSNNAALDIFPMDAYKATKLDDFQKAEISNKIKYARQIFDKKFLSKTHKCKISELKKELNKINNEIIMENQDACKNYPALFYGIDFPYDTENYLIYNYDEIFPLINGYFEGQNYPIPHKSQAYLKNLYEDFMKFPDIMLNI